MARFGDGLAEDVDLVAAAERAVARAMAPLTDQRPDLVAVFVTGGDADTAGHALARAAELVAAPATIGCTAAGVIGERRGVETTNAVAVWCAVLPDVRTRGFALKVMPADAGMAVVGMPERQEDDAVVVLLADPWSFPVDGFIEQSNRALAGLPIVGGMAAGSSGRGSTRLLLDGRVVERGAVGVVLAGAVAAYPLVSQGCRPIGPAMTVTAAQDNVILELAGVAAIRKLEEVVAGLPPVDQALVSRGLQLGIARDEYADEYGPGDFLVRGIAGAEPERGGLVVGDVVPVGTTVRFQARDADAADQDLAVTLNRFTVPVEGALLFSCNGRGAHLFSSADHDPVAVGDGLATTGIAGCFAAGEIGPVAGRNYVHGFTASILAFGTAPSPP